MGLLDDVFGGSDGVAKTLVHMFGGSAVLMTPGMPDYDPEAGTATPGAAVEDPVDISALESYESKEINGTAILKGDCHCTVPACDVSVEPVAGASTLTVNGTVWHVVDFKSISAGSTTVLYELHLRK